MKNGKKLKAFVLLLLAFPPLIVCSGCVQGSDSGAGGCNRETVDECRSMAKYLSNFDYDGFPFCKDGRLYDCEALSDGCGIYEYSLSVLGSCDELPELQCYYCPDQMGCETDLNRLGYGDGANADTGFPLCHGKIQYDCLPTNDERCCNEGFELVATGDCDDYIDGDGSEAELEAEFEGEEADDFLPCDPTCLNPMEECLEGECVCASGYHDGGDGNCVDLSECSFGWGIPEGGEDCVPVDDFCPTLPCKHLTGWAQGECRYGYLDDGANCEGEGSDPCATHYECKAGICSPVWPLCSLPRPVVFMHGINGSSANWNTMIARLIEDGWPEDYLFAIDAEDPSWTCNIDNAEAIRNTVEFAMNSTCSPRVDLVAHSMGTLSSRYYVKNLGGTEVVNTYVTLGGMHHGLLSSCFAPDFLEVCVWREICQWGDFVAQLNEDPATPGPTIWVSIYGTADATVPNSSSLLEGAELIEFEGVEHSGANGLLEREDVYEEVRRVLQYDCW